MDRIPVAAAIPLLHGSGRHHGEQGPEGRGVARSCIRETICIVRPGAEGKGWSCGLLVGFWGAQGWFGRIGVWGPRGPLRLPQTHRLPHKRGGRFGAGLGCLLGQSGGSVAGSWQSLMVFSRSCRRRRAVARLRRRRRRRESRWRHITRGSITRGCTTAGTAELRAVLAFWEKGFFWPFGPGLPAQLSSWSGAGVGRGRRVKQLDLRFYLVQRGEIWLPSLFQEGRSLFEGPESNARSFRRRPACRRRLACRRILAGKLGAYRQARFPSTGFARDSAPGMASLRDPPPLKKKHDGGYPIETRCKISLFP